MFALKHRQLARLDKAIEERTRALRSATPDTLHKLLGIIDGIELARGYIEDEWKRSESDVDR